MELESVRKNPLDDGRFQVRESPLKNSYDTSSTTRGIFSAFVVMFGLVFLVTIGSYIMKPELFEADLAFFQRSFANFPYFITQWSVMFAAVTLITFPATKYHVMNPESNNFNYQICIFATVMIISVAPLYTIFTCKFHQVLSCAVIMEQIRFMMKLVSYLVENGKKKRHYEQTNDASIQAPTLKSLIYFMFAPTLIYRDEYPSSNKPTSWTLVASYSAQILSMMFMALILIRYQLCPRFEIIGKRALTVDDVKGIILWSMVFAWFIGMSIGYAFLHCWMNLFAELLHFGDRLFYKDWISATDAMDFLRTWNFLIHAWIAEYMYKPIIRSTSSKPFAIFVVMAMAGLIHDYVINMTHKYFLLYETTFIPVMLFTTCWTQWKQSPENKPEPKEEPKVVAKKATGTNIGMWSAIGLTNLLEVLIITAEMYAVRNCPRVESNWKSGTLTPRFLSCPSFDLR